MAKTLVPDAKDAMNKFKMEAANEVGPRTQCAAADNNCLH